MVTRRSSLRLPNPRDYRPLIETPSGRLLVPARATVTVEIRGTTITDDRTPVFDESPVKVILDVELIDRRYAIVRIEAMAAPGWGLDLEEVGQLETDDMLWILRDTVRLERVEGDSTVFEEVDGHPDPNWEVASIYSLAYALHGKPTQAVARHFKVSENAAGQRVKRARDAGLLPPTRAGRAS